MAIVIKRMNDEVIVSSGDRETAINELLETYGFEVETTDEEVVEFEGAKMLASRKEEILEARQQAKIEKFNKEFFNTSLGYIRRKVSMAGTGEVKNFLSDILPLLEVGTPVLVYSYLAETSENKQATEQFISECKQQIYNDFYPSNEEE